MSQYHIREFEITDEIRELRFSRIYAIGKTLDVIHKTVTGIEKSLTDHRFDKETITKVCALLTQVWLASVADEEEDKIKS